MPGPDLDESLEQEIDPAPEVPLHRPRHDPNDRAHHGQGESEQDRDPEPIDETGEDVASLIIGAEPVLAIRGRWRRGAEIPRDRTVVVLNQRPNYPSLALDQSRHVRVSIVGLGLELPPKRVSGYERKMGT